MELLTIARGDHQIIFIKDVPYIVPLRNIVKPEGTVVGNNAKFESGLLQSFCQCHHSKMDLSPQQSVTKCYL